MVPLAPHDMGHMDGGMGLMAPLMGGFSMILLVLAALLAWQLWRRRHQLGSLWRRAQTGAMSAEHKAREILAERFARGEIDAQEFMERASLLNWTPGLEPKPPTKR